MKKRRGNDDPRPCACGLSKGRGYILRDDHGVDHIDCEACRTAPRFPYWRPRVGPYPGSIGESNTPAQGDFFGLLDRAVFEVPRVWSVE